MMNIENVMASGSKGKILHHQKGSPRLKHGKKCPDLMEAKCIDGIEVLKFIHNKVLLIIGGGIQSLMGCKTLNISLDFSYTSVFSSV